MVRHLLGFLGEGPLNRVVVRSLGTGGLRVALCKAFVIDRPVKTRSKLLGENNFVTIEYEMNKCHKITVTI